MGLKFDLKKLIHNYFDKSHEQTYDELRSLIRELQEMLAKTDHPIYLILANTFVKNYLLDEGEEE